MSAAEIESAAIGVDVVEADAVEIAVEHRRLHAAMAVASALRAAEIESAAVGVDVGHADAIEIAVEDRRLHARDAVAEMTRESLRAAEIEGAAIRVDAVEVDVVEVAGFDAGLHEAVAFAADARNARSDFAAEPCAPPKLNPPPLVLTPSKLMLLKLLVSMPDCTSP